MSQSVLHLKVETLTPLHIGSGRELQGNFEYLYFPRERKVALIQEEKILNIIGKENVSQWLAIIERKDSLLKYLQTRNKNLKPGDVAKRIMSVPDNGPDKNNNILEQMVDGMGKPLLPGSSLKGAVRTAVLNHLLAQSPELARTKGLLGNWNNRNNRFDFKDRGFQNQLIAPDRTKDIPNHDIFRLFRPGDVFFSQTEVFQATTFNKKNVGWIPEEKISPWLECIPAGQVSMMRLTRPEDTLLRYLKSGNNQQKFKFPLDTELSTWHTISKIINQHTHDQLEEELLFWAEEGGPALAGTYMDRLKELKKKIADLPQGSCLLRIGYGGGVNAMTGGWQKKYMTDRDYQEWARSFFRSAPQLAFPKTRKVTPHSEPLGFVLFTPLAESEVPGFQRNLQKIQDARKTNPPAELRTPEPVKPAESAKPQYPAAGTKIKPGLVLDAYVYKSPAGKQKKIRLYIEKGNDQDMVMSYVSDNILGEIILVEVQAVKDGKIIAVRFKSKK